MKKAGKAVVAKVVSNPYFSRMLGGTVVRLGRYVAAQKSTSLKGLPLFVSVYREFCDHTRLSERTYCDNLRLVDRFKDIEGSIVECGVWRGGMIAGIARILGCDRTYYLFDSFEGLPKAKEIDGEKAVCWQAGNDVRNCRTEETFAQEVMRQAGAVRVHVLKGWFDQTLKTFPLDERIAVLRLDADWYSSTAECLNNLYSRVAPGGLIIVDDYFVWDGCARAIHDFLSYNKLRDRIQQFDNGVCYLVKSEDRPAKAIAVNPE
jgi:O-methyltransferase